MRISRILIMSAFWLATAMMAQDTPAVAPAAPAASVPAATFQQVVDRVTSRERQFIQQLRQYSPIVETYIQILKPTEQTGDVPDNDQYFLGRLDMSGSTIRDRSYMPQAGLAHRVADKLSPLFSAKFMPQGFMQMIVPDVATFDTDHYDFSFVRREFLGDVRCLVIDVSPKPKSGKGLFLGRMWVEDQGYNIVRFNGSYAPKPAAGSYFHFDSWRLNVRPGLWLPAYVYSEESDLRVSTTKKMHFKSQTRLWGYGMSVTEKQDAYSAIVMDDAKVKDESEAAHDATPVQAQRDWEAQAEENFLERLEKSGLLAPPGEVDKVVETVVNNLEITNHLDIQPEVHARVLLTAPLESFTVGRTIVLSRGMLDVLPDEATLAAILAHEMAHITLGHRLDTTFAFSDRMLFRDEESLKRMDLHRDAKQEMAADEKAVEYLKNSPYKDKLGSIGLFLEALSNRQKDLPYLLRGNLGNSLQIDGKLRMRELLAGAPQLQPDKLDQIAALPLGARTRVDIWSNTIELTKSTQVALISPREKMPFEVTPMFPYLTRYGAIDKSKVAQTAAPASN